MNELRFTITGVPITKKNSQQIVRGKHGLMILPSKKFREYQQSVAYMVPAVGEKIDAAVNLKCVYFMPTKMRVDLVNLLEATCDLLVHYGVLADDNSNIVAGHDGSRVMHDKDNPRVEVTITPL